MSSRATPITPTRIVLHRQSRALEIAFDQGAAYRLPAEYLRVFSPSAEVRGHGTTPVLLVSGKINVGIQGLEPVGDYALKIEFDDGHDSGLFTWEYLAELGATQTEKWADYCRQMDARQQSRDPAIPWHTGMDNAALEPLERMLRRG